MTVGGITSTFGVFGIDTSGNFNPLSTTISVPKKTSKPNIICPLGSIHFIGLFAQ